MSPTLNSSTYMIAGGWICNDMARTVVMSIMLFSAGSNSLPASR
jgi:hypothetical protein